MRLFWGSHSSRSLPAFRWLPQSFEELQQQNSSDSTRLKCYRNYGSSTTLPSGAYSVRCLDAAASNDRSWSVCNAPLKRVAWDQLFLGYRLPLVSRYAARFGAVRESFGIAKQPQELQFSWAWQLHPKTEDSLLCNAYSPCFPMDGLELLCSCSG